MPWTYHWPSGYGDSSSTRGADIEQGREIFIHSCPMPVRFFLRDVGIQRWRLKVCVPDGSRVAAYSGSQFRVLLSVFS